MVTNACCPTEHLLTPLTGPQREGNEARRTHNFHLSQCGIRIEMALGQMVGKWRILKAHLVCFLESSVKIVCCILRLHNFCIDEGDTIPVMASDDVEELLPPECHVQRKTPPVNGRSMMRDLIVEETDNAGLFRPERNIRRND